MKTEYFTKHPKPRRLFSHFFQAFYEYMRITQNSKFKYKPMFPSNHIYQSHAARFPALLTVSAELCCLKIHELHLFTRTTQAFPSSFCVKGQDKSLRNSRKYDTVPAHSFNLWIDRPLRSMLCYAAPANQRAS